MKTVLVLFGLCTSFFMLAQEGQVTVEEAQSLLSDKAILLDVREDYELAELAYLSEGMLHIPLSELESRYKELPHDKMLIVACRTGNRSQKAIDQLAELGVSNTLNLAGGILVWQGQGFPVIIDGKEPAPKACCSKSSAEGKSCCSGKSGTMSCGSKKSKSSGSDKKN